MLREPRATVTDGETDGWVSVAAAEEEERAGTAPLPSLHSGEDYTSSRRVRPVRVPCVPQSLLLTQTFDSL